jgi:hypothetical protein
VWLPKPKSLEDVQRWKNMKIPLLWDARDQDQRSKPIKKTVPSVSDKTVQLDPQTMISSGPKRSNQSDPDQTVSSGPVSSGPKPSVSLPSNPFSPGPSLPWPEKPVQPGPFSSGTLSSDPQKSSNFWDYYKRIRWKSILLLISRIPLLSISFKTEPLFREGELSRDHRSLTWIRTRGTGITI